MEVKEMAIGKIIPYHSNPRKNEDAIDAVAASIEEFGFQQPIVVDKDMVIIVGHTRYAAAKQLGLTKVPVVLAKELSEEQARAYRLADNKTNELAKWDEALFSEEISGIEEIDMSLFGFGSIDWDEFEETTDEEDYHDDSLNYDTENSKKLSDMFGAPPMSVIDTKQGYWQNRKRLWASLGIESEIGRKAACLPQNLGKYGRSGSTGVSMFDPALCEIMYKWFNVENGSIYDCFAGGSVRGIVAEKLGYKYTGIELRPEQVKANKYNAKQLNVSPTWHCDDSLNADKYLKDESVDMCFTCPPYADLEVYSDLPNDISNMDYDDFLETYSKILSIACKKLKQDRFFVIVIGDVRGKNGAYRDLLSSTKNILIDNGLSLYNELILLESLASARFRAGLFFRASRKVVKVHQNVLVFYKGDINNIKANYKEDVNITELDDDIDSN